VSGKTTTVKSSAAATRGLPKKRTSCVGESGSETLATSEADLGTLVAAAAGATSDRVGGVESPKGAPGVTNVATLI